MDRARPLSFVAALVIALLVPCTARSTTPLPLPLTRDGANGVWTAFPTDEDGLAWIVQATIGPDGKGTLRVGQSVAPDEISELPIDAVQVKGGRLHVHATSAQKPNDWQTITIDARGKLPGERTGVANGQLIIRDERQRVVWKLPIVLLKVREPAELLSNVRQLAERMAGGKRTK